MNARRSNKKVTPFGGAIPVLKQIKNFKIPELIRESLGTRVKQAKYGYEDVIVAWMLTNLCGGFRLDHITKLRKTLDIIPGLKLPSHDTLGRVMKSLSSEVLKETDVTRGKRDYQESIRKGSKTYKRITTRITNDNEPMNDLLASVTSKVLLNSMEKYDLDLDVTPIFTNVHGAKEMYKKSGKKRYNGFAPMVACIGKYPVYIEMRDGNVSPGARILESVQKSIENLEKNNISIGCVRMDRGGFVGAAFDYLDNKNIKFVVGARKSKGMLETLAEHKVWRNECIETSNYDWQCETADFEWSINKSKDYRLIVLRIDRKRDNVRGRYGVTPSTWVYGGQYAYKIIITNNRISTTKEIIEFYNQRGTSEKNFDGLKNDFGWKLPPFSYMEENAVFLIIAALTNNVFQALIQKFNSKIKVVKLNSRLREFIFVFMSVSCERQSRGFVFHTLDIAYEEFC